MKTNNFWHKNILRLISVCLVTVMLGGMPCALAASRNGHFLDMPENHWAYSAVEEAYEDGAISGRGGDAAAGQGIFAPDEVVTYAEFVAMFVKAYYSDDLTAAQPGEPWYAPYIKVAIANKLLTTDSLELALAKGNEQIIRYDMAEILVKILANKSVPFPSEAQLSEVTSRIADWDEISQNKSRAYYVARAYALNMLSGTDEKGTFKGNAVITRAVAAVIYSRSADYLRGSQSTGADFTPSRNIDHIQRQLPDYALGLYHLLEEATDNDGVNDYLIEDKYFTAGTTMNLLDDNPKLYDVVHTPDGSYLLVAIIKDDLEASKADSELRTAIDLFEIDHPDVFLRPSIQIIDVSVTSAGIKTHHFFLCLSDLDTSFDIRSGYTERTFQNDISKMNTSIDAILADMPEGGAAEKVKYFNQWLTTHNDYNTESPAPIISNRSISALLGSTGAEGPVCVGYSFALKVLCDRADIPCLVIIGSVGSAFHAWNYVQIDGAWYAVDVTWNDPPVANQHGNRIVKALSGYESEEYLLVGKSTVNGNGESFEISHNLAQVKYPLKGIELSSEAYVWE